MPLSAPLTLDNIRSTLATTALGQCLYLHQELPSTNSEALALAHAGAAHGTVVVAESQSAGKGRRTRTWHSPPGANIYCSVVVRGIGPECALAEWLSWVPLTSALAAAEAIQTVTSLSLSLKWPNDLLLHERKIGGILCESSHVSAADTTVVIGIGLNVNMPQGSFPDDLRSIATSLFEVARHPIDRNRLIAQLLFELEQGLNELRSHGSERLRRAYTARCSTLGRRVRALMGPEQELLGTAESISTDGALQIRPVSPSPAGSPLIGIRAADVIHLKE
jgi:BirA family transcriptional regulator, biotin operon repressor / biotin---[acetyl-CoA-carboxylase] ligase